MVASDVVPVRNLIGRLYTYTVSRKPSGTRCELQFSSHHLFGDKRDRFVVGSDCTLPK